MRRLIIHLVLLSLINVIGYSSVKAQTLAVRTNAASWALPIANVGVELVVTESNSVSFSALASLAPLHFISEDTKSMWGIMAEHRYWLSHQPFKAMYVGPVVGFYYYKRTGILKQDIAVPMGLGFGYDWPLSYHWNIETGLSAGWVYYTRHNAESTTEINHHFKPSLINVSLSAIYVF